MMRLAKGNWENSNPRKPEHRSPNFPTPHRNRHSTSNFTRATKSGFPYVFIAYPTLFFQQQPPNLAKGLQMTLIFFWLAIFAKEGDIGKTWRRKHLD